MNPQQRQVAETFLNSSNKEEAFKKLMQQYGVNQEQIDNLKKMFGTK